MYDLLKGLTVVEGAAFVAGPSCALYLAQMGAEVIRFDQIGGGPDYNRWPLAPDGSSFYWEGLNKAKKSVALDLVRPEGRALAQRLAVSTGVFVTNYPVDGFLSYEKLAAMRADLILVRIMGWADGGPAVDYTVNAAIGLPFMTGPVDAEGPVNHVLPAWDLLTGAYAAFSLLAAERARAADGKGREVRLPLSDMAMAAVGHLGQIAEVTFGADRPRLGNDLFGAFGRDFATADGQRLIVIAITPRHWAGLVKALGVEAGVAALEAETGADFTANEGARFIWRSRLFDLIEPAIAARTVEDLTPALNATGMTWGAYQSLKAAASDPRFQGRLREVTQPSGQRYLAPDFAATIVGEPETPLRPAPRLGEHTEEVLSERLGLSATEIRRLVDEGLAAGAVA